MRPRDLQADQGQALLPQAPCKDPVQCPTHSRGLCPGVSDRWKPKKQKEGVSLGLAPVSPAGVPARSASPWVQRGAAGFRAGTGLEQWGGADKPSANTVLAWVTSSPVPSQKVSSLATKLASISTSVGQIWAPGCNIEASERAKPEVWTPGARMSLHSGAARVASGPVT